MTHSDSTSAENTGEFPPPVPKSDPEHRAGRTPPPALPPPPPPPASLPPVPQPELAPPPAHRSPTDPQETQRRQSLRPRQPAPHHQPVPQHQAAPPQPVSRQPASHQPEKPASRWRGQVSASQEKEVGEPQHTLEPVRKSIPAWLVSMIFHITLLLIFALWTTPIGKGLNRVILEFGEAEASQAVDLQEFALESSESEFEVTEAEQVVDTPQEMKVETMIESLDFAEPAEIVPMDVGASASEMEAQPMFGGRTGAMKAALVTAGGGSADTMQAVELGLKWLAKQQERNGSWSLRGPYEDGGYQENRTAATAMAMLAFQGDGNTHFAGPYSKAVQGGLDFLLRKQGRKGFLADGEPRNEKNYAHAQATIALCELYGMTEDSRIRLPAQMAIDYSIRTQGREGGWRYQPNADSDLSVTGWFVMALTSAKAAGLKVEPSTMRMIDAYIDTVAVDMVDDYGASYAYQKGRPASPAMTAEGLLCRQYLGWPRDREAMAVGLDTLVSEWPISRDSMNVYYWYYATQAIHHYGGSMWRIWNDNLKTELPAMQVKRGPEAGSWSPQADEYGNSSGRLYTTCLSIYCLEVYYRHLPLYKLAR